MAKETISHDNDVKKRVSVGTIVFYSLWAVFTALAVFGIFRLMIPLEDWLIRYEASQPGQRCEEVFQELFGQPDWGAIYDLAGVEDTKFEGKNAYTTFMESKVGSKSLTYAETSAGLSGDHKYVVSLDKEKIATFTLTNTADEDADIPDWVLGTVEVFFNRTVGVSIQKNPDHTVYINGVALDDSNTVRTVTTRAESYLPEGVHGFRMEEQYLDGLLIQPEITVLDSLGNPVPMIQDAETGTYVPEDWGIREITEEEKALAIAAAKADALYSIRAIRQADLRNYFDANSQVYTDIISTGAFIQSYQGYTFDEATVTDYYRYNGDLFSANVSLNMHVTRKNGSIKTFSLQKTYFFTLQDTGNYLVTQYTNVPIQETLVSVRLRFVQDDKVLESVFVSTTDTMLTPPEVTVPQGKTFTGWAVKADDGNGKITMTVCFIPDETGKVPLHSHQPLEPMTLYAVFANEKQEA